MLPRGTTSEGAASTDVRPEFAAGHNVCFADQDARTRTDGISPRSHLHGSLHGALLSWEQRMREMLLAGGALAAGACSSQSAGSAFTAGAADATADAAGDASIDSAASGSGCCNASGDPCCEYLYCDAGILPPPQCLQEMACQAEGGVWEDYPGSCSLWGDGGPDSGEAGNGAPGDTGADGDSDGGD